ncbi:MAG: leucine-rich repeat protein [Prevotella sp.]|nr:leucine-rich repeat protein [Prevotella sp.]
MKKKLLKFLCTSLFALVCLSVNATVYNGNCGDSEGDEPTSAVTWSYDTETSTLTLTGTGAIKTFGSSPGAYPWNDQDGPAATFNPKSEETWTGIQTLIVGEGITNIPAYAFHMQENLMSVSLPSTLKSIGNSAMGETAIWNICLPEGLETIGAYAFIMSTFESISIPSTVTEIGEAAFAYGALTSIGCYASTPPTLGNDAFGDDVSGITAIYVPSAKVQAYKDDENWSIFGDNIQSPAGDCGTDATWSYEMVTRTLTISGTGAIEDYSGWDGTMGGAVGSFNPNNFNGYPCGIKRVVIGEGITEIPGGAFYMEVGITSVSLPSTLNSISTDAFGECNGLETITCNAADPPTLGDGAPGNEDYVFYENDYTDPDNPVRKNIETLTAICVPITKIGDYKDAAGWSTYADLIQMPNTTVGDEHWATFYDEDNNYKVEDENTSVWIAWVDDDKVYMGMIPDGIIPAGSAVIIRSTGIPVLNITTDDSDGEYGANELLGSEDDKGDFENYNYYALANAGAGLGFYKVGNGTTIPAGKAYLKIEKSAGSNFYGIDPDDNTTAIKNMKIGKDSNVYYDLSGRRVLYPKKGLYIMNGKKVIIK